MMLYATALAAGERLNLPNPVIRAAVKLLVSRTRHRLHTGNQFTERDFAREMENVPIAIATREANDQHYDLPPDFFSFILGPQRKYSCCYYSQRDTPLTEAEEHAIAQTAAHAALADGQRILELGCGWGALSLWIARRYPASRIVAVSNSHYQRSFISKCADHEGLRNLTFEVADMNTFNPEGQFDRVISVEMFEHMSNWRELLRRISSWMTPEGALFLHLFNHCRTPYRFDATNPSDWIARHFFTGGIMPSAGLIRHFQDIVQIEEEWRWDGTHYKRTAEDWLANFERNAEPITEVMKRMYGREAQLWRRRWRLFFHATAGLFGDSNGQEWGVSHYRLKPARVIPR
jgi:cyclopropane-fatty-acyl-phospholipid synthase